MTTDKNLHRDLQRLDQNIARWAKLGAKAARDGEAELAEQYAEDVAQLRALRRDIERGQFAAALDRIERLDTLVRDQVPQRLYNTIFEKGE